MSGVSWDSVTGQAAFAAVTGAWSTDYPIANLANTREPSQVGRLTPSSGVAAFTFILPALAVVQFIGLVAITAATGNMRIRLYSDNNPAPGNTGALVHDSGAVALWPSGGPVSGYVATRPYVLPSAVSARSGRLDFDTLPANLDLGGVDIAKWWDLPIAPGKAFGFKASGKPKRLMGAATQPAPRGPRPRTMSGEISLLKLSEASTTGLDFQTAQGRGKPFVFVDEYESPASWPRRVMLATNTDLPPSVGAVYRHDRFQFRFTEHLR